MMQFLMLTLILSGGAHERSGNLALNPTDRLAIDLLKQHVRLAELRERLTEDYLAKDPPELQIQEMRVERLKEALRKAQAAGFKPDEDRVAEELQIMLCRAEAELDLAEKQYTSKHPRIRQLQLNVAAMKWVEKQYRRSKTAAERSPGGR